MFVVLDNVFAVFVIVFAVDVIVVASSVLVVFAAMVAVQYFLPFSSLLTMLARFKKMIVW